MEGLQTICWYERETMRMLYVLRYFIREALTNLWSNRLNNLISLAIIVFSMFTLGLFLLTAENLSHLIGKWTENVQVNAFLKKGSTRQDAERAEAMIKVSPCIARYSFVTEQEALRRFNSYYPGMTEITTDLDANPFPPSFEIVIRKEFQNQAAVEQLVRQLRSDGIVEDVEYDQEWINRVQFIISFIRIVGSCFGAILMFTAIFSISNVIKLMVLSRKDEIEIMRLVGATNSFIKGPFITEGIVQGMLGGATATVLLYGLYLFVHSRIAALNAPFFSGAELLFLNDWIILSIVAGGMTVGFVGSFFSLSKLVRI